MPEATVIDPEHIAQLVAAALAEDIGDGDKTTQATVPPDRRSRALIRQKQPGVIFGLQLAEEAFAQLEVATERRAPEGAWRDGGEVLAVEGLAASILSAERVALNFLGRLSGIATLTAQYVMQCRGTKCRVLDTRKTTPLLRVLEKAAVVGGGGVSHRFGLFDEILIKENHIAAAGGITAAVHGAQERFGWVSVEVECRTRAEVDEALEAGVKRLLLDNMSPAEMAAIVTEVDGRAILEASGNVTVATVREVAQAGLDFVSVGALTHSAPALDLSLLMEDVK
ncbi:MAG TPA: carboxylating nicotinate-nucleotide diphosphorylase [Baekduia sp.]|nr:carboxylating nicotinate-nucleotide diphosphorylase [Baekduia sp.]